MGESVGLRLQLEDLNQEIRIRV